MQILISDCIQIGIQVRMDLNFQNSDLGLSRFGSNLDFFYHLYPPLHVCLVPVNVVLCVSESRLIQFSFVFQIDFFLCQPNSIGLGWIKYQQLFIKYFGVVPCSYLISIPQKTLLFLVKGETRRNQSTRHSFNWSFYDFG